jgi:hypothetical protein
MRLLCDPDYLFFEIQISARDVLHLGIAKACHPDKFEQHVLEWVALGQKLFDLLNAVSFWFGFDALFRSNWIWRCC